MKLKDPLFEIKDIFRKMLANYLMIGVRPVLACTYAWRLILVRDVGVTDVD